MVFSPGMFCSQACVCLPYHLLDENRPPLDHELRTALELYPGTKKSDLPIGMSLPVRWTQEGDCSPGTPDSYGISSYCLGQDINHRAADDPLPRDRACSESRTPLERISGRPTERFLEQPGPSGRIRRERTGARKDFRRDAASQGGACGHDRWQGILPRPAARRATMSGCGANSRPRWRGEHAMRDEFYLARLQ